ncbi:FkbM family methyltransferase [Pseudoflavitalea rhizosphaerae]|uniref:FkbM family methyltransferase n=1 Tax=Pseudoflavitalea rhizosphaerae TaxID=1884793 RepID=UPI000F8DDE3D|nr:FkbM family methyltransferase [Pseudoflavitalea rhizosphaerae]
MIRENGIKAIASIMRVTPSVRGKHRLGKLLERYVLGPDKWKKPACIIPMKAGYKMHVDVRSATNNGSFWTGNYDTELITKLCNLFEENWTVLDIGGNIGYYTVPFARKLKQLNGKLLTFEPVSTNFKALNQNIELNDVQGIVSAYKMALGNEEGTITMNITEEGDSSNAYIANDNITSVRTFRSEQAPMHRLDDFIKSHPIQGCDFIKVDIEGAEIFLFQGAPELLAKYKPVVYGEFNPYFMSRFGFTFLDVWKLFSIHGYECYQQQGKSPWFKAATPAERTANVLLIPPGYDKKKLEGLLLNQ